MTKIYTCSMSRLRKVDKSLDVLDITVASGSKYGPTWSMVKDYKAGILSEADYTRMYYAKMRKLFVEDKKSLIDILEKEEIVLVCFCPPKAFCHRHLLLDILEKIAEKSENYSVERGGEL